MERPESTSNADTVNLALQGALDETVGSHGQRVGEQPVHEEAEPVSYDRSRDAAVPEHASSIGGRQLSLRGLDAPAARAHRLGGTHA